MKQLLFTILLSCVLAYTSTQAQNVGIGTTTPKASAILDVSSTTKGVLLPRMNTTQRNAIASPDTGLIIFNTDDMCTDTYDGSNWIKNCGLKQGDSATIPENSWIQKVNFGGSIKNSSVGFSIGNKGYIGTGFDNIGGTKDFWEYDPSTNVWKQKVDFGGSARYGAVGFSIGSKGYIGTGNDENSLYKKDFWEYDPLTNAWLQKANFGGTARAFAVGFSIGSKGYIGTGDDGATLKNDFWEYNPSNNEWIQKANFGGTERQAAVGFSIGSKGYISTGLNVASLLNDFWEFDPSTAGSLGTWAVKTPLVGSQRYVAVGFSIGDKGYIGTGNSGGNSLLNDFWEYDPSFNTWMQKANFGGGVRSNAVGFSIGSKGYIGLGYGDFYFNDFWEYNSLPLNVATYNTLPATLSQSNVSDASWTKTVLGEIKSNIGNVNIVNDKMGIGTATPSEKLEVAGKTKTTDLQITNGAAVNKILTSDANGNATWQTPLTPTNFWTAIGNNISNNNTGNVGIGTVTPNAFFHVFDGNVVFSESNINYTNPPNPPFQGFGGARLMWYSQKAAFRAGGLLNQSLNWNKDSVGYYSFSAGIDTKAKADYSTALGNSTSATGQHSTAMGNSTVASAASSTAMGSETIASAVFSTAIGNNVISKSVNGLAVGSFNDILDNPFNTIAAQTDRIFQIGNGSASNTRSNAISVLRSGNVGIGNTDPAYLLDLSKRMRLRSENTSQGAGIWFNNNNNTAENIFLGNDASNNLQVYSNSGLRTIATFNPTSGGLRVEGPTATASGNAVASFGGFGDFLVDVPGTVGGRFIIKENGNAGIGNNNPSEKLVVNGNILASSFITPSDIRYKKDIRVIPNAIKKLLQLNGVYYNLRTNEFPQMGFSKNEQVGLLAQDVEKVMPNVVVTNTDGYKGVDYAKLVPLLIESIKELKKELDDQQKLIKQLLKNK